MKRLLISLLVLSVALTSGAYHYKVGGIYYNKINQGGKACLSVTYCDSTGNSYAGTVTVPERVLVTIKPAVTAYFDVVQVGACAFRDCPNLESVSLPSSITSIDSCAFQHCAALASLDFPASLRSIGDNAFEGCAALTHVTIPGQFDVLGRDIFKDCAGIQSVVLQEGVSMIPPGMFKGCSGLTSISFRGSATNIGSEAFAGCAALERIDLANVKTVGSQAFSHSGLSSVTITAHQDNIGREAFSDCGRLDTVNVGAGCVATFARDVFARCDRIKVIECGAMIPPTVDGELGLAERQLSDVELLVPYSAHAHYQQALGWRDFANILRLNYDFAVVRGLEPIYYRIISDDEVSITYKDESYASYTGSYVNSDLSIDFWGSSAERFREVGVDIPAFVDYVGKKYWVTEIGDNAFRNSTNLTVFGGSTSTKIKRIGKNAFKGCTGLRFVGALEMFGGLTEIDSNAFEGCTRLHYIEIPSSVTEIGSYAFAGCSGLRAVSFQSPAITVGSHAFSGTSLAGHALSDNVGISCLSVNPPLLCDSTVFDANHYANTQVKVLYSSVDTYRADDCWRRFAKFKANCFDFKSGNIYYRINDDGETVSVAPGSDVYYASYDALTVSVPEKVNFSGKEYVVSRVAPNAFLLSTCSSVVLPNSIRHIGDFAFQACHVNRVALGDSVETIGTRAFYNSNLYAIHLPKSVKSIGQQALLCPELSLISVEDGNPRYDSRDNCNALIETATNRLLVGCGSSTIPSSVVEIADSAFIKNVRLSSIVIPETIKNIGAAVFAGCYHLQAVSLPSALSSIGHLAFMATGLNHVTIPDEVETIGDGAFMWNEKLRSISIGAGVKTIGQLAFATQNLENSLQSVVCKASTPPEMAASDCFDGGYAKATLYVPAASLALYKNDANWSQFYRILPLEENAIEDVECDEANSGRVERFDLMGRPVGDDYRGIIIENGRKLLKVGSIN